AGDFGGGCSGDLVLNSIVYGNFLQVSNVSSTNHYASFFTNSCTAPLPSVGANNITDAPLLRDDLRLQPASPCRNTGSNPFVALSTDLDGNPRIVGSAVDMGAYENGFTGTVRFVSLNSQAPAP